MADDYDYMETVSGVKFFVRNPNPEDILLDDIIHALSLQCRFNGHCTDFYSVLEHSYHIAKWLYQTYGDPLLAKQGALHDATESYMGDFISPLKPLFPEYKIIENSLQEKIFQKFGLPRKMDPRVHEADVRMLKTERMQVMRPSDNHWKIDSLEPLPVKIRFYPPASIRYIFRDLMNSPLVNEVSYGT